MLYQRRLPVRSLIRVVLTLAFLLLLVGGNIGGGSSVAQAQGAQDDGLGTPKFKSEPLGGKVQHVATTIPYWSSSFTSGGVTYPYSMVGTDPTAPGAITYIDTEIIPLSFTFSNGETLDGASKTTLTVQSPIFQPYLFQSGYTQYGDAIQRAEFWTNVQSSPYHVLLNQPTILATQKINVPANQGTIVIGSRSHAHIGLMDYNWFSSKLKNLLSSMHISAKTLPIFLVYNVFLYEGNNLGNCCVLGYHGATSSANGNGTQQVQTYMFASFSDPGIFRSPFVADVHGLSHELSEWMNDPFVNNFVPPWLTPTAPQYGCTSYLETGDPVVGIGFDVPMPNGFTYHPEDEVFFSWFAREAPSRGINGWYTYMNSFPTYSSGC